MTIEKMIQRKKELGYSYEKISELSGVPAATVQKIFSGVTKSPRYETIQALERLFREDILYAIGPDSPNGWNTADNQNSTRPDSAFSPKFASMQETTDNPKTAYYMENTDNTKTASLTENTDTPKTASHTENTDTPKTASLTENTDNTKISSHTAAADHTSYSSPPPTSVSADILAERNSGRKGLYNQICAIPPGHVSESAVKYLPEKKQGEYTISDYCALPDEQRAELIDGVLYDMSAPLSVHQLLAGYIHADLLQHVQRNKGNCLPLISPFDVQLDCDNKTIVQPDVMILCDRDKLNRRRVYGAPDFIIEILSPSTRLKDMTIKLRKYMLAGVREYWILWPYKKKIAVYRFDDDSSACPTLYTFQDQVPVGIWEGTHKVDMAAIYEQISFIYDRE